MENNMWTTCARNKLTVSQKFGTEPVANFDQDTSVSSKLFDVHGGFAQLLLKLDNRVITTRVIHVIIIATVDVYLSAGVS